MTDFLILADARTTTATDFFRDVFGLAPRSAAENAEREARAARYRLIEQIEKVEFARARREREAIIRDGIINGTGDYDAYMGRVNRPFAEARERVAARVAEFDAGRLAA